MSQAAERMPSGASTAHLRGHPIYFRDVGEGVPVLLLHGLGASSHVYEPLLALRHPGFRYLAFDLPHSGRSGGFCRLNVRQVAAEAAAFLDRLEVSRAIVVGHSFGGVVAMEIAARFPQKVAGMVVAAAPAVGLPGQVRQLLALPGGEWAMQLIGRMPVHPFFTRSYLKLIFGDRRALTEQMVEGYVAAAAAPQFYPAMLEGLRDLAAYRIPVDRLAACRIPSLVLWGDRDKLASAAQGEQVARAIGARLQVLEGIGHCIPEERPQRLAEAISTLAAKARLHRPARAGANRRIRR